ncbi:CxC2 domain-containing protein [Mycena kentingensis (nom. inval.)]|nr:CxC2 domain-containing protein [Mycena kentingensis (nom. inval.)]
MVLPTSVGDLQKGERYANMDYIFLLFMRHLLPILWLIVSYNIACQWSKHLRERLATLPPALRLAAILKIAEVTRFAIPKMHIKGHIILCQLLYTLGLLPGAAASTRASGPGSRADQLNDHWNFWNWLKILGLALLLRRRLDKATSELSAQESAFTDFSVEHADNVPQWVAMVDAFEADSSKPNPYQATTAGLTEQQVRDRFEEEEAKEAAAGQFPAHEIGPAEFMTCLLDVEEDQCRVHSLALLKRSKTTAEKINLRRNRRTLNKSIAHIRALQAIYMPSALVSLDSLKLPQSTVAEMVPLLPPSALLEALRGNEGCRGGLVELERQLRNAQCRSALASLRLQLHVKQRLLAYKRNHSCHQGANTRSRALIARNESKILRHSDKYQAARRAMIAMVSIQVEWCKSYARVRRWREEVRILQEEWRRLSLSFAHAGEAWANCTKQVGDGVDAEQAEGLVAYAAKQAEVYHDLGRRAEITRTAPKLRRGQRGPRDEQVNIGDSAEMGCSNLENLRDASDDDDDEHAEVFVDEHGNVSDDKDFILDGDAYD